MRQRPLVFGFLILIIIITVLKATGLPLWGGPVPDKEIRDLIDGSGYVKVSGTVIDRNEKTDHISYILSDAFLISDPGPGSTSIHKVRISDKNVNNRILIGSKVQAAGDLRYFRNSTNPGGFDSADYYAGEDLYFNMSASDLKVLEEPRFPAGEAVLRIKKKIRSAADSLMGSDEADVLCAMLLGDKKELSEDVKLDYSASGLSHLLAISGLHVMLLGMMLYRFLLFVRLRIAPAALISTGIMAAYCVFSGGIESTIRACIMYAVMMISRCILRSYDPLNAMSLAGILMLAIRPALFFRAGFQLSFSALFAVTFLFPAAAKRLNIKTDRDDSIRKKVKMRIISAALLWFCVNVVTMPVILYHYYEFSLYSILGNLLFIPFMGAVLILGMTGLALGILLPPAGSIMLAVPGLILKAQDAFGGFIRQLPSSKIIVGRPYIWQILVYTAGLIILILMLKRGEHIRCMMIPLPLLLVIFVHPFSGFMITALDTGQGDCLVIRKDSSCYMIDGGSTSSRNTGRYTIVPYLRSQGIAHIDAVFLTHGDEDHMNGLDEMFDMIADNETAVRVDNFVMPVWLKEDRSADEIVRSAEKAGCRIMYAKRGDQVADGDLKIEVISPDENDGLSGNEGSLVLEFEIEGFRALFTGDVEGEGEEKLIGRVGKCDLYKTAHHGSKYTNSPALLDKTDPEAAIITAPEKSVYGHPHKETLERFRERGISWYQTGLSGAVTVTAGKDGFDVSEYLEP